MQNLKLKFKIQSLLPIILFLAAATTAAHAEEAAFVPYTGYVNDYANVISSQDKNAIESLAQELDTKTTAQIAVVTIKTTSPLTIEQYAVELFQKWGIGKKGKDNGVLILMAVDDRAVRIEVGYGLEGAIPDAIASRIIRDAMMPEFKKGNLSNGLVLGAVYIARLAADEYNIVLSGAKKYPYAINTVTPKALLETMLILVIFLLIFGLRSGLLFYFLSGSGGRRGKWYHTGSGSSLGGFGGGFGGFGGGMSGGGGASGRW